MTLYFDTSALIKKYLDEKGSQNVDDLLSSANKIYTSIITEIESVSILKRLLVEKEITSHEFSMLKNEIEIDFTYYTLLELDQQVIAAAKICIEKYQLKSLDSIHLGSALTQIENFDLLVSCDEKLLLSAKKEKIPVCNPICM